MIDLGSEEEVHQLSLMFKDHFFIRAKCLVGKTPEDRKAIIGPHPDELYYNKQFKQPSKPDLRTWKDFGPHILVPFTCSDDESGDYPEQPGMLINNV
jgi:hypothetical protein